jgi:hypothetical protein
MLQVRTLLSASDSEEGDGQVDFGEFVVLVRGFQSSAKERAHQQVGELTGPRHTLAPERWRDARLAVKRDVTTVQ